MNDNTPSPLTRHLDAAVGADASPLAKTIATFLLLAGFAGQDANQPIGSGFRLVDQSDRSVVLTWSVTLSHGNRPPYRDADQAVRREVLDAAEHVVLAMMPWLSSIPTRGLTGVSFRDDFVEPRPDQT